MPKGELILDFQVLSKVERKKQQRHTRIKNRVKIMQPRWFTEIEITILEVDIRGLNWVISENTFLEFYYNENSFNTKTKKSLKPVFDESFIL